jgi:alginate O-acetyltransferase complex protein AlgI
MLFNSLEFFIFLPSVFILYWFIFQKNLKYQNSLLLISSYIFYGWWDWRFLSLILLSTIIDYFIGIKVFESKSSNAKKVYLCISIIFNLGLLGFFKYFNFFIDSWISLLSSFGYEQSNIWSLNIVLPVGISFYTFQTMSYSLDIYLKKLTPTKDFISFAAFVSFFPQLVAGPIERASNLLPQIRKKRKFNLDNGILGLRQILWGMFKKVVIADSLSPHVDYIFKNYNDLSGGVLLIGLFYFSYQIYCDFSGYSDIAIGTAKLFGINLMVNFNFPYFSRDIAEFWRRWHISLSSWFRDYLYIPLGGSKKGKLLSLRNIFLIFIVSGFWHGANWTFIIWGLIHSLLYVPLFLSKNNRKYLNYIVAKDRFLPSIKEIFQIGRTFFFTMIAWVFFRSPSVYDALSYLYLIPTKFSIPQTNRMGLVYVVFLIIIEWIYKNKDEYFFQTKNRIINWVIAMLVLRIILAHFNKLEEFIYFQF